MQERANKKRIEEFEQAGRDTQAWADNINSGKTATPQPNDWPETQPTPPESKPEDLIYINDDGRRDPYAEIQMQEPPF